EPVPDTLGMYAAYRRTGSLSTCFGQQWDNIYFIEDFGGETDGATYRLYLLPALGQPVSVNPTAGDTLRVIVRKPFTLGDEFRFKINEENLAQIDKDKARQEMDNIKVVPNPYIVTNPYERRATSNNRQQQRELHFT